MTLWQLAASWPCDYASIERPKGAPKQVRSRLSLAPPTTISVHLDGCRKCAMQKKLLELDEKLKTFAERSFGQFAEQFSESGADDMSAAEFQAIKEHAQFVREEMLGCPKG